MKNTGILFFLLFFSFSLKAQKETSSFDTTHSPKKAALLSAVLPGAGQVYNKKWWKVPVIYAGIGTSVYFLINNNRNYHLYRNEYLYRIENNGLTQNAGLEVYSESNLLSIIDQYQRWRDLSIIAIAGFYALQIIDATVDGYLYRFDTSDDLSFRLRPSVIQNAYCLRPGLKIQIKF